MSRINSDVKNVFSYRMMFQTINFNFLMFTSWIVFFNLASFSNAADFELGTPSIGLLFGEHYVRTKPFFLGIRPIEIKIEKTFSVPKDHKITYIHAVDNKFHSKEGKSSATINLVSGGLGERQARLKFKAEPKDVLDYTVFIFGAPINRKSSKSSKRTQFIA